MEHSPTFLQQVRNTPGWGYFLEFQIAGQFASEEEDVLNTLQTIKG